jgi:hypothetical protein
MSTNPFVPKRRLAIRLLLACTAAIPLAAQAQTTPPPGLSANATVFARGFDNPRGSKFGPDGNLYVAEAGRGGTTSSTIGLCPQAAPPGPYTNARTARISRVSAAGVRSTVIEGLPSGLSANGDVMGVSDVAFVGSTLYALLSGGGCAHGEAQIPAGILRINANATFSVVADLGAFVKANPVKSPVDYDFDPDGTWYGLASWGSDLYAVESNHAALYKIATNGQISRMSDISAEAGHRVPTAVVLQFGEPHVASLGRWPFNPREAEIWRVGPTGSLTRIAHGMWGLLGFAFDYQGRMYALEVGRAQNKTPIPGTGRVVRVTATSSGSGSVTLQEIASGLMFPTSMTYGPDGNLYVTNNGFGFPSGAGEVVRITIPN